MITKGPKQQASADHIKCWLIHERLSDIECTDDENEQDCKMTSASEADASSEWPSVGAENHASVAAAFDLAAARQ